jgi:hypothetical protein
VRSGIELLGRIMNTRLTCRFQGVASSINNRININGSLFPSYDPLATTRRSQRRQRLRRQHSAVDTRALPRLPNCLSATKERHLVERIELAPHRTHPTGYTWRADSTVRALTLDTNTRRRQAKHGDVLHPTRFGHDTRPSWPRPFTLALTRSLSVYEYPEIDETRPTKGRRSTYLLVLRRAS